MGRILMLKMGRENAMLAGIEGLRTSEPDRFIRDIRAASGKAAVQAVDAGLVAGKEHILEVLRQSLRAKENGALFSKRVEVDLLLRIACTNQISSALRDAGIKQGTRDALVIAIGGAKDLQRLARHLKDSYRINEKVLGLSRRKEKALISHHGIGKEEVRTCVGENKLASLLAERANLLW